MRLTNIASLLLLLLISCGNSCFSQQPPVTNVSPTTATEVKATSTSVNSMRLTPAGYYSNVHTYGEHESGFTVELWHNGDTLTGLIRGGESMRLMGDPPTGLLEDVSYDRQSGRLVFTGRISILYILDLGKERREVRKYEFDGFLRRRAIEGVLTVRDPNAHRISIKLPLSKPLTREMESFEDIDKLMAYYRVSKPDIPK